MTSRGSTAIDLITWLRVQLDADVRATNPQPTPLIVPSAVTTKFPGDVMVYHRQGCIAAITAYRDQTRVLAEIEAKQQILNCIEDQLDSAYGEPEVFLRPEWLKVLRLLALLYADRLGYRPEWVPEQTEEQL